MKAASLFLMTIVLSTALLACAAPTPSPAPKAPTSTAEPTLAGEPTILFSNGTCAYTGTSEWPYGLLEYSWSVQDVDPVQYGLITFSLLEGKSLDDFRAWDASGDMAPPDWVINLAIDDLGEAGGSYQYSRDLSPNAKFKGDPVYMACYRGEPPVLVNILGPFAFHAP